MRVVIVGNDLSCWLTAYSLSALLGSVVTSICVLDDSRNAVSNFVPVHVVAPQTLRLLEKSGISEADLLAHAGASFHLGYAFTDWLGDGATHFLATGIVKAPIGPVSFHNLALRISAGGTPVRLSDYSLEAMCAQTQRFAPASSDPRSILSTLNHGLHIETDRFIAWLKQKATRQGSRHIQANIVDVTRDKHGNITLIQCADGLNVEGDLFVDCSGTNRALSPQTFLFQSAQFVDLRCNWTSRPRSGPDLPLFVHALASNDGWTNSLCTQNHEHQLCVSIGSDCRSANFGRLDQIWSGNCVAIGEAAASFPNTTDLGLHVIAAGLDLLMTLLPSPASNGVEAHEYNRIFAAALEQAQTWAALPFVLNQRLSQPFWNALKSGSQSTSITALLDTWTQLGRLNAGESDDWFEDMDWVSMLWAFGAMPLRYDQVADGISKVVIAAHFAKVRSVMHAAIGKLPSHADYIHAALTR
jgi:tryptophan 7-halogenase